MNKRYLIAGVVGFAIVATAAGAAYKSIPVNLRECDRNKDYYAEHERDCDRFEYLSPFSGNKGNRARAEYARAEYGGGYSSYPRLAQVSVVPDFHGTNESNNNNTLYMYTQTTANVANSGGVQPSYGQSTPRAADAGVRYANAPAYAYAPRYVHRHAHRHETAQVYIGR